MKTTLCLTQRARFHGHPPPLGSQALQYDILGGEATLYSYMVTELAKPPKLITAHKPNQVTPRPGGTSQIPAHFV